jgi:hypothetical protein
MERGHAAGRFSMWKSVFDQRESFVFSSVPSSTHLGSTMWSFTKALQHPELE